LAQKCLNQHDFAFENENCNFKKIETILRSYSKRKLELNLKKVEPKYCIKIFVCVSLSEIKV